MERFTTFKEAIKLVALYQATLEQMDTMKGTRLYRQNIKKMMGRLETEIERAIRGPLGALDSTDEELMTTIQGQVEMILNLSLEELVAMKMVVDEHREPERQIAGVDFGDALDKLSNLNTKERWKQK